MIDFTNVKYINTRGLAQMCDVYQQTHPTQLLLSDKKGKLSLHMYKSIQDDDRVYVPTTELDWFISNVLPKIDNRFILLTGSADFGPTEVIGLNTCIELCHDTRIKKWYAQNIDFDPPNDKVTWLPIGLDYHKDAHKISPQKQEENIMRIQKENTKKKDIALGTFHHNMHIGWDPLNRFGILPKNTSDRNNCLKNAPNITYLPHCNQTEYFKKVKESTFLYSPSGKGFDTHRFYEAIVLGSVPIITKDNWLYRYMTDLPVNIIEKWSDNLNYDVEPNTDTKKVKLFYWNYITKNALEP